VTTSFFRAAPHPCRQVCRIEIAAERMAIRTGPVRLVYQIGGNPGLTGQ